MEVEVEVEVEVGLTAIYAVDAVGRVRTVGMVDAVSVRLSRKQKASALPMI